MRRQRNIFHMKEEKKTLGKKLSNGDKQFIRYRIQNTGYKDTE